MTTTVVLLRNAPGEDGKPWKSGDTKTCSDAWAEYLIGRGDAYDAAGVRKDVSSVSGAGTPDLVVLESNPFGLEAAIACCALGGTAVVLASTDHIGGMMTGGLSAVDIPITEPSLTITGAAWQHQVAVATELGITPEKFVRQGCAAAPSVVERVYRRRLNVKGLTIVPRARLTAVSRAALKNIGVTTTAGAFVGYSYIDASYTGDMLRKYGISLQTGRIPVTNNVTDKDSFNGIRPTADTAQFDASVSPYIIPGDASSGLCRGISATEVPGSLGAPSSQIMAFNYRVTVCQVADAAGTYTKLPMPEPTVYDAADWELLGRHIQAKAAAAPSEWLTVKGTERATDRALIVPLVNSTKMDFNNGTWVQGTNLIGPGNLDYLNDDDPSKRAAYEQRVKDQFLGFFKFLRTDPRVPAALRADAATYGLPSDEKNFVCLYVRVGPQMIGDVPMTDNKVAVANASETTGVSVINYSMDSHTCRVYVSGGQIFREGNMLQPSYTDGNPIPFAVLKPKASECVNMLSGFALNASYSVMCSLRMEPELQAAGQAAGIAAFIAARRGINIVDVQISEIQAIQDRFGVATKGGAIVSQSAAAPYNGGGVTTAGTWSLAPNGSVVGRSPHAVSNGTDVTASTSGSSTTLTIAAVAAGGVAVAAGQYVSGPGVVEGTTIASLGTSTGGTGTVNLSTAANVPAGSSVRFSNGLKDWVLAIPTSGAYDLYGYWPTKTSSTRSARSPIQIRDVRGVAALTVNQNAGGEGGNKVNFGRFSLNAPTVTVSSTSGASTTLTVASVSQGALAVGLYAFGPGIPYGTTVTAFGTGTGGTGTYTLSVAATVPAASVVLFATEPHVRTPGAAGGAVWESLMAVPAT